MGRCPFHEERTPSFSVNAIDKFYYCFGCGAKGDLITFVRDTEQLDFAGAIEWLADRFNVQIEYEETTPEQDARRRRRERLFELLDAAATFYERYLWDSQAGVPPPDLLRGRHLLRALPLGLAGGLPRTRLPRRPRLTRRGVPRIPARPRARRHDAGAQGGRARVQPRRARRCRACQSPWQRLLLRPSVVSA